METTQFKQDTNYSYSCMIGTREFKVSRGKFTLRHYPEFWRENEGVEGPPKDDIADTEVSIDGILNRANDDIYPKVRVAFKDGKFLYGRQFNPNRDLITIEELEDALRQTLGTNEYSAVLDSVREPIFPQRFREGISELL